MIKTIIEKSKNLDNKVKDIMINGFRFSFVFSIISVITLLIYKFYTMPILYYSGIILFKTSLMFFVDFIILGIGFDTIKKQMA